MSNFPLFSVIGIEIEYMLVHRNTLDVQPKSDCILKELAGKLVNEIALDDIAVSNELVMHVLELKNNGPKPANAAIATSFQNALLKIQPALAQHQLMLLPTAAHPWMDPYSETQRWPHQGQAIYQQFNAIFNCQGHGWSNLQSMHINLPYATQEEFCHLHNSIRLILPLLPALAASSPLIEGKPTGKLDSRLHFYSKNQQKIPSICGDLIPEFISTEDEYQQKILKPMYEDIKPYDPQGVLQYPWLNSRGAIVKPDLKAIEIRIIDTQECVEADIAIALAIHALLEEWHGQSHYYLHKPCDTQRLKQVFYQSVEKGMSVIIDDFELMAQWQLPKRSMRIREIWSQLIEKISYKLEQKQQLALELILSQGNLSERILCAIGKHADKNMLRAIYNQLAHCLITNQQLLP